MDLRRRRLLGLVPALAAGSLAGCSDGGAESGDGEATDPETTEPETTEASDDGEPLSIGRLEFAAAEPQGYRDYDPAADATFGPDETVWLYLEPEGVATEPAGGGEKRFSLEATYSVTDPGGREVDAEEQIFEQAVPASVDPLDLFVKFFFTPESSAASGVYEWTIELHDRIDGERTQTTAQFSIGTGSDYAEQFRRPIESELDVEIVDLQPGDGVVDFEYETDAPLDSEDGRYQMGFVAGRYARVVQSGWETERLRVVVTDGNGDRYRWHVTAETARAWNADEVTDEEFVRRVTETIESL